MSFDPNDPKQMHEAYFELKRQLAAAGDRQRMAVEAAFAERDMHWKAAVAAARERAARLREALEAAREALWNDWHNKPRIGTEDVVAQIDRALSAHPEPAPAKSPIDMCVACDEPRWQHSPKTHTHEFAAPEATGATGPTDEGRIYPCDRCGTMRTKDEGGAVFTVCDECWDRAHPEGDETLKEKT